jgi:hypothetical protein
MMGLEPTTFCMASVRGLGSSTQAPIAEPGLFFAPSGRGRVVRRVDLVRCCCRSLEPQRRGTCCDPEATRALATSPARFELSSSQHVYS